MAYKPGLEYMMDGGASTTNINVPIRPFTVSYNEPKPQTNTGYARQDNYRSVHSADQMATKKQAITGQQLKQQTTVPSFTGGGGFGTGGISAPSVSTYDKDREARRAEQNAKDLERENYLKSEAERIKGLIDNIGSTLTKPGAPERATRDNLSAELQSIYDELDYYRPDWDSLQSSHNQVMGIYGQQRENIAGQFENARGDLQTSFDRALGAHERGQDNRRQDFGEARRQLTEQDFMNQRNVEAGAASRGLGESGVKEMAQIQGRMAMGQGMNEYARQYYQMEEEGERAIQMAREDYESTTVKLQQSLQSALTEIGGAEVMSIQQYTDKVEGLKRQMEQDKQATAMAKQNFLQTEFETRSALAAFQQAQYESDMSNEYRNVGLKQDMYGTELDTENARRAYEQTKNQGDDSWQSHRETLDQRKWEAEEGFRLQRAQMAQSAALASKSNTSVKDVGDEGAQKLENLADSLYANFNSADPLALPRAKAQLRNAGAPESMIREMENFANSQIMPAGEETGGKGKDDQSFWQKYKPKFTGDGSLMPQ